MVLQCVTLEDGRRPLDFRVQTTVQTVQFNHHVS